LQQQFFFLSLVSNTGLPKVPNVMDDDIGLCLSNSVGPAHGLLQVESALNFLRIDFSTFVYGHSENILPDSRFQLLFMIRELLSWSD
jgi:hypothetical protein